MTFLDTSAASVASPLEVTWEATAAAGSRPVSRAKSAAHLDAAAVEAKDSSKGSGRAAAASGKRRASPLPDNMRQTQSRH